MKDRMNPVDPKARSVANIIKIDGMDPDDYSKNVSKFAT